MAYSLWLRPAVHAARRQLPGHVRQRLGRAMDALGTEPRPARSRRLRLPEPSPASGWEVRRIRVEDWRIVYAVSDERRQVAVLAVRRRPPYDYDDLEALLTDL